MTIMSFHCKRCGEEISEMQFQNYNQLCSQCIRLERTVDKSKAESYKGINFGLALLFTLVTIVLLFMILFLQFNIAAYFLIIPVIMAIVNWYFYFKNKKISSS